MSVLAKVSETKRGPDFKSKMSRAVKITLVFWRGGRKHKTLMISEKEDKTLWCPASLTEELQRLTTLTSATKNHQQPQPAVLTKQHQFHSIAQLYKQK